MKSAELGQNFLRNRRTARRLVHIAGAVPGTLCVDLGAGKGMITEAILLVTRGPMWAVEKDARLARFLKQRFAGSPSVHVLHADLLTVPLPHEPFVVAGNIPFNLSTQLVRRWMIAEGFRSGALIIEREFGLRLAGEFGTTKLSASLGAILDVAVEARLNPSEFHPRPSANLAIVKFVRKAAPLVARQNLDAYWMFLNYLFEQSRRRVGDSLAALQLTDLRPEVGDLWVREAGLEALVEIFANLQESGKTRAWQRIVEFEQTLPAKRRALTTTAGGDRDAKSVLP